MFTGIIEAVGEIAVMSLQNGDARVQVKTGKLDLADVALGDSVAVNGVCLTAIELTDDGFWADVSCETINNTCFQIITVGTRVNLEKALMPTTRLGGHLVSGHVDGIGKVLEFHKEARSVRYSIEAPNSLARYIAKKGSICIDGASLTVNQISGAIFDINIVPHTIRETVIGGYRVGTLVNLEVDLIARYLERLLLGEKAADAEAGSNVSLAMLRENGFA